MARLKIRERGAPHGARIVQPVLEAKGMKAGIDFFLAFSPERVDPGNPTFHTGNVPKVVGGVTPECSRLAAALYGDTWPCPSQTRTFQKPRCPEANALPR